VARAVTWRSGHEEGSAQGGAEAGPDPRASDAHRVWAGLRTPAVWERPSSRQEGQAGRSRVGGEQAGGRHRESRRFPSSLRNRAGIRCCVRMLGRHLP